MTGHRLRDHQPGVNFPALFHSLSDYAKRTSSIMVAETLREASEGIFPQTTYRRSRRPWQRSHTHKRLTLNVGVISILRNYVEGDLSTFERGHDPLQVTITLHPPDLSRQGLALDSLQARVAESGDLGLHRPTAKGTLRPPQQGSQAVPAVGGLSTYGFSGQWSQLDLRTGLPDDGSQFGFGPAFLMGLGG